MISLIAIGITNYEKSDLTNIECADKDVLNVYNTFQEVFSEQFSQHNSISLIDITSDDFKKVLSVVRITYKKSDTLVVYFSGHADLDGDDFFLCFKDYDGRNGRIKNVILYEELHDLPCKVIIVLDCCRSAGGLALGNKRDLVRTHKISVIASSDLHNPSFFTNDGSLFTFHFVSALKDLNQNASIISLNEISKYINLRGSTCLINLEEGATDIVLKQNDSLIQWELDFPEKFLMKTKGIDFVTKELLWYSLMDVPTHLKWRVMEIFFLNKSESFESSWLVRRAIGSVLNEFDWLQKDNKRWIIELLESYDWTKVCVGIIGSRYYVNDEEIYLCVSRLLNSDLPMDVVWLANLYISSSKHYNFEATLNSRLMHTEWGVIEIWKTISNKFSDKNELLKLLQEKTKNNPQILNALFNHLHFSKEKVILTNPVKEELKNSKLINEIYKEPTRNTIAKTEIKNKWLISYLYGVWRDQIRFNLAEFLEFFSNEELIKNELQLVSSYPLVEMRMAIIQFISDHKTVFDKYKDSLLWSLLDPHPWVRRSAIKAFKNEEDIKFAFLDNFDRSIYPGVFDFILEANYYNCSGIREFIEMYDMSAQELRALGKYGISVG